MIPYEERKAVYTAAIAHYGPESRYWLAVEEMAELMKELAKGHRPGGTTSEALVDEIADVTIMMEQLRLVLNVNDDVQDRIDYKVTRLLNRMKEGEHEGSMEETDPCEGQTDPGTDGSGQGTRR